jgi:hypothetical protein
MFDEGRLSWVGLRVSIVFFTLMGGELKCGCVKLA